VAVIIIVGGNDGPLARICGGGKLAIPDLRRRHDRSGIVEAHSSKLIFWQRVLIGKAFYLGEGLIPVEIGIVLPGHRRDVKAERILCKGSSKGKHAPRLKKQLSDSAAAMPRKSP